MFVEFNWTRAMMESPILLILCCCSVVMLGVAIERLVYSRRRNGDADGTLLEATAQIRKGNLTEAINRCKSCNHPMGVVSAQVLENAFRPLADVEECMQVSLSQQKLLLERNLGTLGTMAAVTPLIGLLGTVWGIMRAFHDMAATGSAAPSIVAAGVAEALVTTAGGLVIAVPALLFFNHFSRRLNVMLTVAENHARSLRAVLRETVAADESSTATRGTVEAGKRSAQDHLPDKPEPAVTVTS
jgi:biopolymer transport protein ExbB